MGYRTFTLCLLSLFLGCSTPQVPTAVAETNSSQEAAPVSLEEFVLAKLKHHKLNHSGYADQLATLLKDPKKPYERTISLNLLGFLGKADYSVHYSDRAIRSAKKFLKANGRTLHRAEKKYGVPKEVIAGLLWVETQYGAITGRTPIVQAYLSLLMADHPEVTRALLREGMDRRSLEPEIRARYPDPAAFEQKIIDRTRTKSEWAMEQLKAIDSLRKGGYKKVLLITGSFAGAFGVPQFIPSTYKELAVSSRSNHRPNLYKMPDVILSVANFLKKKGWNEKKPDTRMAALYEYNRIRDYGEVILRIANELNPKVQKAPPPPPPVESKPL